MEGGTDQIKSDQTRSDQIRCRYHFLDISVEISIPGLCDLEDAEHFFAGYRDLAFGTALLGTSLPRGICSVRSLRPSHKDIITVKSKGSRTHIDRVLIAICPPRALL